MLTTVYFVDVMDDVIDCGLDIDMDFSMLERMSPISLLEGTISAPGSPSYIDDVDGYYGVEDVPPAELELVVVDNEEQKETDLERVLKELAALRKEIAEGRPAPAGDIIKLSKRDLCSKCKKRLAHRFRLH